MKKAFLLLSLVALSLFTSCNDDNESDLNVQTLVYDAQDHVYKLNGGEWKTADGSNEIVIDRDIDDEFTIHYVKPIEHLRPLEFGFEYCVELNGNSAWFYASDLYEYMDNTEIFIFEITTRR